MFQIVLSVFVYDTLFKKQNKKLFQYYWKNTCIVLSETANKMKLEIVHWTNLLFLFHPDIQFKHWGLKKTDLNWAKKDLCFFLYEYRI